MKIKSTQPPEWLMWVVIVLTFPAWCWIPAIIAIDHYGRKWKRSLFGPYVTRWQNWFAWFPVRFDGGWGEDIYWLETVSRKAIGSSYGYGIVYEAKDYVDESVAG